jgi:hypothetical protein
LGFEQRCGAVRLLGEVVERTEQDYCVGGGVRFGNDAGVSHLRGEGMLGLSLGRLLCLLDMEVQQVVQMDQTEEASPTARSRSEVEVTVPTWPAVPKGGGPFRTDWLRPLR